MSPRPKRLATLYSYFSSSDEFQLKQEAGILCLSVHTCPGILCLSVHTYPGFLCLSVLTCPGILCLSVHTKGEEEH